mmetsp:Transcript_10352/g.15900  ORF Transcript_10352/g.15900 Transcript_10352/m.15900 type:complete len:97 (-) Transcript_10352:51-341(-)
MALVQSITFAACYVPLLPAGLIFLNWFMGETSEKSKKLSTACKLVILQALCLCVWGVLQILLWGVAFSLISNFIINAGITFLFYMYFATVCDRYAN